MEIHEGRWEEMHLPCGKTAVLNQDKVSYTCTHCNEIIGSAKEPPDCRKQREESPPKGKDWWLIDGDYKDG